ncbi:hypothetical protein FHK02_2247 [Spirosoma sp. LMG 31448]|nr:hypothetical protein [Spirosoma utsteinense]
MTANEGKGRKDVTGKVQKWMVNQRYAIEQALQLRIYRINYVPDPAPALYAS